MAKVEAQRHRLRLPVAPLAHLSRRPEVARFVQFSRYDQQLTADEQKAWLYAGWGLLPPGPDMVDTVRLPGPRALS